MAVDYSSVPEGEFPQSPVNLSDGDFSEAISKWPAVVVDMWAEWCGPCKRIAPTLDKLAAEFAGRVVVGKLNVDHNTKTPGELGVRGIPTLFFFQDGALVDQVVGMVLENNLRVKFNELCE